MSYGNSCSLRTLSPAHVLPQKCANEDNLRKKADSSFVLPVAVASSSARIEGNRLAPEDKVLREISGPRGGRFGVLQCTELSASLTLK
jgi:hypothetical protein